MDGHLIFKTIEDEIRHANQRAAGQCFTCNANKMLEELPMDLQRLWKNEESDDPHFQFRTLDDEIKHAKLYCEGLCFYCNELDEKKTMPKNENKWRSYMSE